MKMLTVCVLGCAMMVLVTDAAPADALVKSIEPVRPELINPSCSKGWFKISDRCFLYVPKPRSWAEAERNCLTMGAHLASVHNINEYHRIQKKIAAITHDYKETWIGGSNAQQVDVWLWSDGTIFHYSDWCPGKPAVCGSQHCLQMNHEAQKCWNDVECDVLLPSVCTKKAMMTPWMPQIHLKHL
ncbi:type-2 ice-structuring protein-like [Channa argus]|uniref:type-2 ice-structuring protein-like n=1 Tax=Channa argus TaxID=215402 RepID=UPI00351FEC7E